MKNLIMNRFPFYKKVSEIFETRTSVVGISEKFQKFRNFLNFRKANHSTENSGNSVMKIKWNGNFQEKMSENLAIPHQVVFFFEIMQIQNFLQIVFTINQ